MIKILLFLAQVALIFISTDFALAQSGLADSPWPMFHGDVKHTGLSKYDTSHVDGTLKWTFEAGGGIESSPAIGTDGTIYIGTKNGKFYAINPDGSQEWIFQAGDDISATSAVAKDGTIYIGSWDRYLYVLTPDGKEKWRFETPPAFEAVSSSAAIGGEGTIYFGSNGGIFYALNPDGSGKWHYDIKSSIPASPAIAADGTVYIPSYDKKLYAFSGSFTKQDITGPAEERKEGLFEGRKMTMVGLVIAAVVLLLIIGGTIIVIRKRFKKNITNLPPSSAEPSSPQRRIRKT